MRGVANSSEAKADILTGDEEMFTWYEVRHFSEAQTLHAHNHKKVDLDEALASQDELADLEWEGHVADKVWEVKIFKGIVIGFECLEI